MNPKDKYSPQFRADAVRQMQAGVSMSSLSKKLGVSDASLRNWKNDAAKILADAEQDALGALSDTSLVRGDTGTYDAMHREISQLRDAVTCSEQERAELRRSLEKKDGEIETLSRMVEVLLERRK